MVRSRTHRNTKRRNTKRRNTNRRNTNRRNTKRRNTMRGNFRWMRGGGNVTIEQLKEWIDDDCDINNPLYDYQWPEYSVENLKSLIYLVANNENTYGNPPSPSEWNAAIRDINNFISVLKDMNDNKYYNTNLSID